ncbi:MAG: oxygen-independent coproporphyrinogen III oxidase [Candidatus Marinimicrobia bacterium]|nr:oxygen-independent coproporphyrinogen III oxidase [Candidatus Neomarinimicrobiota bacterium]|tara:strand:+ start:4950 stop:6332 length:1383 start_codon:yes stop_codon:yes gene_type:complete
MNMIVDKKLIDKYNESGPRYTSYPPATFFNEYFNDNEYLECLSKSNYENPKNISVYIHVPFCPQICHFCGCTTETGFTKPFLERYINAVVKEIELVSSKLDDKRKLTQVHWGGGTPNAISYKYIEKITNTLKDYFDFSKNYEMAIECNPAHLEFRHIELLKKFGFNRISVGIQDFRNDVLDAINRKPSKRPIEEIIKKIQDEGFTGTNLDLVYGLPLQTVDSFKKTVDKAISLNTDRIVTFSYAHVPSVIPRQKVLENIGFPTSDEKALMYENSYNQLIKAGYVSIGMDHYSKPNDEFALALNQKKLHRNFQGYCTLETTGQVYGFGASSISQLDSAYSQNIKNASEYINKIEKNGTAVLRGYSLNNNEKVIRYVINSLMCNYYVDLNFVADYFECDLSEIKNILNYSESNFVDFISDSLMTIEDHKIIINRKGRLFTRNISMRFDPLISKKIGTYSNTI